MMAFGCCARWGGRLRLVLMLAVLGAVSLALSSRADAYIYWTSFGGSMARANLDGSGAQAFIGGVYSASEGLAIDSSHVYWAEPYSNAIGRANLDGTGVNQSFITGASYPQGIAVDGAHIYWANWSWGTIGRANLDGSGINQQFITGANYPLGVAVNGQYVYWANRMTIGRATRDGTGVNQSFIGASGTQWVAVDGSHAYWTSSHPGPIGPEGGEPTTYTIGRANLDGSGVDLSFITGGTNDMEGIAVDGQYMYWANRDSGTIARANLNGTGVNQSFIGAGQPTGIAIDALGPIVPQLTNITQSATRWTEGSALPQLFPKLEAKRMGSSAETKAPIGTTFGFTLNRPARVWFVFTYRTVGRLVGGRCVGHANANRGGARCLVTVRALFSRQAPAGRTRLRFQGRLDRKRKLPPGLYRLIIFATANGHRSKPAILRFRILPTISRKSGATRQTQRPAFTG